mmetsp:Transcript_17125/g.24241  ORF Transcript_17125/g.24241 Transcript_17125/m.24241 type:complete len:138 (+) Transcript_17125:1897-2310(+)|eukprot:CAMPEP_0171483004 /NCGR_PEP_ID=MMETSP0946-20130122/7870_1 /TAXON_ID=109269 /ORGANISM="Vaucheria litorea, Strain CCMP2940" /LENGTH=137 /DNA_ID=CAMNT_0012015259 /DNA_START=600 /DNA_END=1013 /DNA_ORIENTATION=+
MGDNVGDISDSMWDPVKGKIDAISGEKVVISEGTKVGVLSSSLVVGARVGPIKDPLSSSNEPEVSKLKEGASVLSERTDSALVMQLGDEVPSSPFSKVGHRIEGAEVSSGSIVGESVEGKSPVLEGRAEFIDAPFSN